MRVRYGNGGWVLVEGDFEVDGLVYVRLTEVDGTLRVTELYIDGRGKAISARGLRGLTLTAIEQWVSDSDRLRSRLQLVTVDLSRLASHFATTFGSQAKHWVADSMRAQVQDSDVPQAPMGRSSSSAHDEPDELRLEPPTEGLTDKFLTQLGVAYRAAVGRGLSPAKTLAEMTGVSDRNVHRWVYTARKRGLMPPATRKGRVV